jgi:pimeloyl-ACP methyl ester carboxylesterase
MLPIFLKLREIGDVIILDQRGTGLSKPNLGFQEGSFSLPLDKTLDSPESKQVLLESAKKWAESLQKKGIEIQVYNTFENAEDIEEIRKALGVEKINIWAFSYGTHLALAYFKNYEKNVHRAILGGVNALDDRFRMPSDGDETIKKIAELVNQTPKLNLLIPDLYRSTKQMFDNLEKKSITATKLPFTDSKVNIIVGKFDLQVALTTVSAHVWFPKDFPSFVYDMGQGKTDFAGFYIRENVKNPRINLSTSMAFSAHCASGVSEIRKNQINNQSQNSIFGNAINYPFMESDFCSIWGGLDLGEEFRKPVVLSNLPVLFMNGDLDGRTSINRAKEVASGFKNGHFITIKNASHDFWMVNSEITDLMIDFLNNKGVEKTEIIDKNFEFRSPLENQIVEKLYQTLTKENFISMQNEYNTLEKSTYVSSTIFMNLCNRLTRENKLQEAIKVLNFAIKKYSDNWRFYQILGELFNTSGNKDMATEAFKKSLELNPLNLRAALALSLN